MPLSKDELVGLLKTNLYDVVHFACHGKYTDQDPDESEILLRDEKTLRPDDLSDSDIRLKFRESRPLIFMNSCHSGRIGSTLLGIGGWASRFIDLECGAFIGCGWEVQSQSAYDFAVAFYSRLRDNGKLSEAMHDARERIRSDNNSTWLAYCLYGDPRCRLRN